MVKLEQTLYVITDGKEKQASVITIFADDYDAALEALIDLRLGTINMNDIPKLGLDVRSGNVS